MECLRKGKLLGEGGGGGPLRTSMELHDCEAIEIDIEIVVEVLIGSKKVLRN